MGGWGCSMKSMTAVLVHAFCKDWAIFCPAVVLVIGLKLSFPAGIGVRRIVPGNLDLGEMLVELLQPINILCDMTRCVMPSESVLATG